jgi:hypothetical protein
MNIKTSIIFLFLNIITIQGKRNVEPYANCGYGVGRCSGNQCCSKYGYCGNTDSHCDLSKGCQTDYGLCYASEPDRCGEGVGLCKEGFCCSRYGYCGKEDKYCNLNKGCQMDYGLCYEEDNGNNDDNENNKECGKGYGSCTNDKCCSSSGKCGTGDSYCNVNNGCQIDYGLCYKPIGNIREGSGKSCGRNVGSCDFPDCCSKNGKCVLGTSEFL